MQNNCLEHVIQNSKAVVPPVTVTATCDRLCNFSSLNEINLPVPKVTSGKLKFHCACGNLLAGMNRGQQKGELGVVCNNTQEDKVFKENAFSITSILFLL